MVFEKDLSLVPGCVDQRYDEKWNIFIDYDSPRGPCPSSGCLLCFLHKMQRKDSLSEHSLIEPTNHTYLRSNRCCYLLSTLLKNTIKHEISRPFHHKLNPKVVSPRGKERE